MKASLLVLEVIIKLNGIIKQRALGPGLDKNSQERELLLNPVGPLSIFLLTQ